MRSQLEPAQRSAYLEHHCEFKLPVKPGDTLASQWKVVEKLDKPKHKGGIFVLQGTVTNQNGELVANAAGKILVASKP